MRGEDGPESGPEKARRRKFNGGGGGVVPLSIALIYIMKNMNNIKPNSKTNSS